MIRTVEAVVDPDGSVRLLEPIHISHERRALLTILDESPRTDTIAAGETALLSEAALAEDWLRPEEEEAWSSLQQAM
jgi:hypothetical protein